MKLNVLGPISITKAVLPLMLKAKRGAFVVTSSAAGKLPAPCSATYSATKHAIQGFFGSARMELCDQGIQITLACPGPVLTDGQANAASGKAGATVGKVSARVYTLLGGLRSGVRSWLPRYRGVLTTLVVEHGPLWYCCVVARQAADPKKESRMSAGRCARYMVAAMLYGVDEVWLSPQPVLLFMYISQYDMPAAALCTRNAQALTQGVVAAVVAAVVVVVVVVVVVCACAGTCRHWARSWAS